MERPRALAADGKRIRGANRLTAEGLHWETVTLVDHATGVPVASRSYREEGGEQWAMRAILEETDVRDVTLTLDAGHAGFDLERALVEQHGADYVLRIKGNCKRTFATLTGTDWEAGAERTHAEQRWERTHTRSWERRSIAVFTPAPQLLSFRHARQAFRITHESCRKLGGKVTVTHSYGISSLPAERATARDLLALMRGHWRVESRNHYSRDVTYGEDRSRVRTGARAGQLGGLEQLGAGADPEPAAGRDGAAGADPLQRQPRRGLGAPAATKLAPAGEWGRPASAIVARACRGPGLESRSLRSSCACHGPSGPRFAPTASCSASLPLHQTPPLTPESKRNQR